MALPTRKGKRDIRADHADTQRIHGYCALCIARCGTVATVEDGRFTRLDPDPTHPTGQAICAKGRAAPELTAHPKRLTSPLRRTACYISWLGAGSQIAMAYCNMRFQARPRAAHGDGGREACAAARARQYSSSSCNRTGRT